MLYTPSPTPIPTAYRGYHFRSRLEARYAVFFDALGWRFEYEGEGFALAGGWYLPDFWLPDLDCFLEVKPQGEPTRDSKAYELVEATGKRVLVARGAPWVAEYAINYYARKWYGMLDSWVFALGDADEREVWLSHGERFFALNPNDHPRSLPDTAHPLLRDAMLAARSARFEHGERGRTL